MKSPAYQYPVILQAISLGMMVKTTIMSATHKWSISLYIGEILFCIVLLMDTNTRRFATEANVNTKDKHEILIQSSWLNWWTGFVFTTMRVVISTLSLSYIVCGYTSRTMGGNKYKIWIEMRTKTGSCRSQPVPGTESMLELSQALIWSVPLGRKEETFTCSSCWISPSSHFPLFSSSSSLLCTFPGRAAFIHATLCNGKYRN